MQDPDFGWHIRAGEYILHYGIPYTDPFSYSMPSYPFVDHEWLTNILLERIFTLWGIVPLLILSSTLAVGSLLLQYVVSEKKWASMSLLISGATLFDFVGIRTQAITWFFLSVLVCVLFQKKLWDKWRFGLPVLFLVWANLHGGFGIGLGVFGVVLAGRAIEERKKIKESLLLLLLCAGATLINPYGLRLWWEFWMQLSDTQLRWSITEWSPAYYFTNVAFWGYWLLSGFLILRYRKRYTWTELFFYGGFILQENPMEYPIQAVAYLHKHLPRQQIFSTYDWGGYLLWKLPEKKDFIDGRMPSWRWQANIPYESNYAFDEYKKVASGQIRFAAFTAKYHITTFLVSKTAIAKPPTIFLGFVINKSPLLRLLFFSPNSLYGVIVQAKHLGWKEVYSDDTAVIYQQQGSL